MPNPPGFCQYPDEWHTFQTTTLGFPRGEAVTMKYRYLGTDILS